MILLFVQCEKEELSLKEGYQPDAALRKPGKPDKPTPPGNDKTVEEYAVISGDVTGAGLASTSVSEYSPFTLTLSDYFEDEAGTHDGEIRILYGTKKKSENRIDFKYIHSISRDPKALIIRAETNTGAYDETTRTLTLDNCFAIIAERDGTGENYTDYTPASATVVFTE